MLLIGMGSCQAEASDGGLTARAVGESASDVRASRMRKELRNWDNLPIGWLEDAIVG